MTAKEPDNSPMPWYKQLLKIKDTIIIVGTPIVLLPIIIASNTKVKFIITTH